MAEPSPYIQIGGASTVHAVVARFYDLMEQDPAYAALRAMHAEDLGPTRESLEQFLIAWLGGPRDWFDARPGACIMGLHRGLGITPQTAQQWLHAMDRAVTADPRIEPALTEQMLDAFRRMARGMAARPVAAAV